MLQKGPLKINYFTQNLERTVSTGLSIADPFFYSYLSFYEKLVLEVDILVNTS